MVGQSFDCFFLIRNYLNGNIFNFFFSLHYKKYLAVSFFFATFEKLFSALQEWLLRSKNMILWKLQKRCKVTLFF